MTGWTRMGVVVTVATAAGLAGAAPRTLTVKAIMGKLNKGPNAMTITLKRELQKADPNWAGIQEETKEYAGMTADLTKTDPPRGDKSSWTKLTKDYAEAAKAMDEAARKKDKSAALAAHTKLTGFCMTCHKAHRD